MLENYKILDNGVIKQDKVNVIKYNQEYIINSYNSYGELGLRMSNLRLGYLIGSIGKVPNSILDVGYGNGDFLKTSSSIIPNCFGNDISGYEIPEGVKFIDNITEDFYDVITFFDVLEHFEDLSFVKDLNCNYVLISVPWCHYFSDNWFESWKHRKPNEHIYHFNKNSLEEFMKENGYSMINYSNIEDSIRKSVDENPNILTAIFKKND